MAKLMATLAAIFAPVYRSGGKVGMVLGRAVVKSSRLSEMTDNCSQYHKMDFRNHHGHLNMTGYDHIHDQGCHRISIYLILVLGQ